MKKLLIAIVAIFSLIFSPLLYAVVTLDKNKSIPIAIVEVNLTKEEAAVLEKEGLKDNDNFFVRPASTQEKNSHNPGLIQVDKTILMPVTLVEIHNVDENKDGKITPNEAEDKLLLITKLKNHLVIKTLKVAGIREIDLPLKTEDNLLIEGKGNTLYYGSITLIKKF